MSLPKQNLDDKTYDQLVEETKALIPRYAPQWTDHNWSDPGITFIDLLSWLTEIALYRINSVNDSHYLKYLKLLGIKPEPPEPSKVDLNFESNSKITLKAGENIFTKIDTFGTVVDFELDEDITIVPLELQKVIVDANTGGVFDRTDANEKADLFFFPFGLKVKEDCAFYLGFTTSKGMLDKCIPKELSFMCYMYEKDMNDGAPGKHGDESEYKFKNAKLEWQFLDETKNWRDISPEDGTDCFKKSGRIVFKGIEHWKSDTIPIDVSKTTCFWLRCKVKEYNEKEYCFEYPPRIETIILNIASATQGRTIKNEHERTTDDFETRKSSGLPYWSFKLSSAPILDKSMILSLNEDSDEFLFSWSEFTKKDKNRLILFLRTKFFLDWAKEAIKIDVNTINICSDKKSISLILINNIVIIEGFSYELIVKTIDGNQKVYHRIWTEVDDFDSSGPEDNHYVVDKENGIVKFGDGLNGRVPPSGSTIRIIQYRVGGGEIGNIKAGYEWETDHSGLSIKNQRAATGGKSAESIEEAFERFRMDLRVPYTTVTSLDIEYIAINTPGLRVAKAKALPNFPNKNEGYVTLVVIPYVPPIEGLETEKPLSSKEFKLAICRHLEKHRLLGTTIHIEDPTFINVNVNVIISPMPGIAKEDLTNKIDIALKKFLHPLKGWKDEKGWPIGGNVYRSDIYDVIEKIDGVNCVTKLLLSGKNESVSGKAGNIVPDKAGNLKLPLIKMTVISGTHSIEITEVSNVCSEGRRTDGGY
jgi:hypothetical protein